MNLSTLKSLTIPEGKVTQIDVGEHTLWKAIVLPDEYQQVEWICSYPGMSSYLDLGFAFDTSAEIYMEQYLDSVRLDEWTYMFGAAENDGIYRCMWSAPGYEHHILYGSTGSDYITSGNESTCLYTGKNRLKMIVKAGDLHWENLDTGEVSFKNTAQKAYTMTSNLFLLAQNYNGTVRYGSDNAVARKVGRFSYRGKDGNLICNLYPCYNKTTNKVGMYDTVRNIFITSAGENIFIPSELPYKNWVLYSTESDGKTIYNGGLGYKNGYRIRSGGTYSELAWCAHTGFIPVKGGDVIRISGMDFEQSLGHSSAINVADSSFTNIGQCSTSSGDYGIFLQSAYKSYGMDAIAKAKEKEGVWKWVVPPAASGVAYVRISCGSYNKVAADGSKLIVTINEELT